MKTRSPRKAGFSLVEVAIALAVASFCLITISGLLSVGLSSSQVSSQETVMANLAGQVIDDLRATPTDSNKSTFYGVNFPSPPGSATMTETPTLLWLKADGSQLTNAQGADYCVSVGINPPQTNTGVGPTMVRIFVTWPAAAASTATSWPTVYSGSYETLIAINRS